MLSEEVLRISSRYRGVALLKLRNNVRNRGQTPAPTPISAEPRIKPHGSIIDELPLCFKGLLEHILNLFRSGREKRREKK